MDNIELLKIIDDDTIKKFKKIELIENILSKFITKPIHEALPFLQTIFMDKKIINNKLIINFENYETIQKLIVRWLELVMKFMTISIKKNIFINTDSIQIILEIISNNRYKLHGVGYAIIEKFFKILYSRMFIGNFDIKYFNIISFVCDISSFHTSKKKYIDYMFNSILPYCYVILDNYIKTFKNEDNILKPKTNGIIDFLYKNTIEKKITVLNSKQVSNIVNFLKLKELYLEKHLYIHNPTMFKSCFMDYVYDILSKNTDVYDLADKSLIIDTLFDMFVNMKRGSKATQINRLSNFLSLMCTSKTIDYFTNERIKILIYPLIKFTKRTNKRPIMFPKIHAFNLLLNLLEIILSLLNKEKMVDEKKKILILEGINIFNDFLHGDKITDKMIAYVPEIKSLQLHSKKILKEN